jgi:hypothetical protein
MRFVRLVAVTWVLFVVVAFAGAAMSGGLPGRPTEPDSRPAGVTDTMSPAMIEGDMQMLERMRATLSPSMDTMIEADPMWVDPQMIRAQEQYQAQIDRMLARG